MPSRKYFFLSLFLSIACSTALFAVWQHYLKAKELIAHIDTLGLIYAATVVLCTAGYTLAGLAKDNISFTHSVLLGVFLSIRESVLFCILICVTSIAAHEVFGPISDTQRIMLATHAAFIARFVLLILQRMVLDISKQLWQVCQKIKAFSKRTSFRKTKTTLKKKAPLSQGVKAIALFTLLTQVGCAGFNNQYQCKPGRGVPCKSMSEINDMIDNNALPTAKPKSVKHKKVAVTLKEGATAPRITKKVIRVPEETMRVYIKAYEDEAGRYHHDSEMNLVVKQAYWKQEVIGL